MMTEIMNIKEINKIKVLVDKREPQEQIGIDQAIKQLYVTRKELIVIRADKIYNEIEKYPRIASLSEKSKISSCLYLALIISGEKRTQSDICLIFNLREITLRNTYRKILEQVDINDVCGGDDE